MAKSTGARTALLSAATLHHAAETKLEAFAEDLGRLLGEARNKADGWLSQRDVIVKHLEGVRDTASHLLEQLGTSGASSSNVIGTRPASVPVVRRAPGRPPKAAAQDGSAPRKRFTMSAEARARIGAAQRARWAKQKAGKK